MTWPGTEPWSPGPLVNTLLIKPIRKRKWADYIFMHQRCSLSLIYHISLSQYIYIYIYKNTCSYWRNLCYMSYLSFNDPTDQKHPCWTLDLNVCIRLSMSLWLYVHIRVKYMYVFHWLISLMSRVFANGPYDLGSIPGRVIPKTLKMVLDTALLNTQQYKVCIKGKVEQFRERSSAFPCTSV